MPTEEGYKKSTFAYY